MRGAAYTPLPQRTPGRAARARRRLRARARARARPRAALRHDRLPLPRLEPDPRVGADGARPRRLRRLPAARNAARADARARPLAALPAQRSLHRHGLRPLVRGHARLALARRDRALRIRLDGDAARLRLALPRPRGPAPPVRRARRL